MIYGFAKSFFSKAELDRMSEDKRVALATQERKGGKTFVYDDKIKESNRLVYLSEGYYTYEGKRTEKHGNNVPKVYVVIYSSYDNDEGLYTEAHVFDSFGKAIKEKEMYINAELSDEYTTFGGLASQCNSLDEFYEEYASLNDDSALHLYDSASDQSLNIDIYEQIVR